MRIQTLVENKSGDPGLACEHGLSLLIETKGQTILFDTGASSLFADNARVLGADLSLVDLAVLSHGHYDHGGGLGAFLTLNQTAPIYIQQSAFGEYLTPDKGGHWEYIGLDRSLYAEDRFIRVSGDFKISEAAEILSEVRPHRLNPPDNRVMYEKQEDEISPDGFSHEQNLVLHEEGRTVLITGCAHKGIVNILEAFYERKGTWPDVVIGGFHLINPEWDEEMIKTTREIGEFLKTLTHTRLFTGHCTGEQGYRGLEAVLGDQIQEISTGTVLELFTGESNG